MRKYLAVLLAVIIIGTTPAFVIHGSTSTEEKSTVATDPIENNAFVASEMIQM